MHKIVEYLGIDDRSRRLAEVVWRIIDSRMEQVIEGFYANTAQRNTGLGLDDATIGRLKVKQKEHWRALFHAEFDDAFFQRASMIGLRHHEIGLSASWYIAGYSIIKLELAKMLMETPFSIGIKIQLVATLEKYVALDMACALSSYSAWLID